MLSEQGERASLFKPFVAIGETNSSAKQRCGRFLVGNGGNPRYSLFLCHIWFTHGKKVNWFVNKETQVQLVNLCGDIQTLFSWHPARFGISKRFSVEIICLNLYKTGCMNIEIAPTDTVKIIDARLFWGLPTTFLGIFSRKAHSVFGLVWASPTVHWWQA